MARQRYYRLLARWCRARRVSVDRAARSGPQTRGKSRLLDLERRIPARDWLSAGADGIRTCGLSSRCVALALVPTTGNFRGASRSGRFSQIGTEGSNPASSTGASAANELGDLDLPSVTLMRIRCGAWRSSCCRGWSAPSRRSACQSRSPAWRRLRSGGPAS